MKRHSLLCGLILLSFLFLAYRFTKAPIYRLAKESWYTIAEKHLVENRASLIPTSDTRLFGMYRPELPWDFRRYYSMSIDLGAQPRILSWYQSWGDSTDGEFKTEAFSAAREAGLIPQVTWEPWVSGFAAFRNRNPDSSLALITQGVFDNYIRRWARESVRHGRPYFLRPMHELGNPWYAWAGAHGNSPAMQIKAWRHIVSLFRSEGAHNVAFVWTPYTAADSAAWPGNEWVDWIGLDLFNYGSLGTHGWNGFSPLLRNALEPWRHLNKPILLSEVATASYGGSPEDWWIEAFTAFESREFEEVRGLVVFDNPSGITPLGLPVDWRMPLGESSSDSLLQGAALLSGFR